MLKQILHEIEIAQGSITIRDLSRKLNVEPNALEGMLQFLVRKGRIRDDGSESSDHGASCGKSCSGTTDCTFIAKMPKTYSTYTKDIG